MKNKAIDAQIIEAIEDAGYETQGYSGRAMYGERCLGVVCENPVKAGIEIMQAIATYCFNDTDEFESVKFDEFSDRLSDPRTDNMGHDMILYWPRIPAPDDTDDNE